MMFSWQHIPSQVSTENKVGIKIIVLLSLSLMYFTIIINST